jgi:hypothetical protein
VVIVANWKVICDAVLANTKVIEKRDSRFMRFLNFFVQVFNPSFLTGYVTTVGRRIYWANKPAVFDQMKHARLLTHENVHAYDARRLTVVLFGFLYLIPQVFALCSLLALLSIWYSKWWILSVGFLFLFAPLPAPFRAWFELRAMYYTFLFDYYVLGVQEDHWVEKTASTMFGGWDYYWMCPKFIARKLLRRLTLRVMRKDDLGLPDLPKNLPLRDVVLTTLKDGGHLTR